MQFYPKNTSVGLVEGPAENPLRKLGPEGGVANHKA